MRDRAAAYFRDLQDRICRALEDLDGPGRFREDLWQREGGGGGRTRLLAEGAVFEKAGVNFSEVFGEMSEEFAKQVPGQGQAFYATGVSLVLHPRSPLVPTVHANFRFLAKGENSGSAAAPT
jgi:coproporphyrinogen III oxidase